MEKLAVFVRLGKLIRAAPGLRLQRRMMRGVHVPKVTGKL
jgi:hypothetical protein